MFQHSRQASSSRREVFPYLTQSFFDTVFKIEPLSDSLSINKQETVYALLAAGGDVPAKPVVQGFQNVPEASTSKTLVPPPIKTTASTWRNAPSPTETGTGIGSWGETFSIWVGESHTEGEAASPPLSQFSWPQFARRPESQFARPESQFARPESQFARPESQFAPVWDCRAAAGGKGAVCWKWVNEQPFLTQQSSPNTVSEVKDSGESCPPKDTSVWNEVGRTLFAPRKWRCVQEFWQSHRSEQDRWGPILETEGFVKVAMTASIKGTLTHWLEQRGLTDAHGLVGPVVDLVLQRKNCLSSSLASIKAKAESGLERQLVSKLEEIRKVSTDRLDFSRRCVESFLNSFVIDGPDLWHNPNSNRDSKGAREVISWCGFKVALETSPETCGEVVDWLKLRKVLEKADKALGFFSPCYAIRMEAENVKFLYKTTFLCPTYDLKSNCGVDPQVRRKITETLWLGILNEVHQKLIGKEQIAASAPNYMTDLFRCVATHPANLIRSTLRSRIDVRSDDCHNSSFQVPEYELALPIVYFETINSLLFPNSSDQRAQFRRCFLDCTIANITDLASRILTRQPQPKTVPPSCLEEIENCFVSPLNVLNPKILTSSVADVLSLLPYNFCQSLPN